MANTVKHGGSDHGLLLSGTLFREHVLTDLECTYAMLLQMTFSTFHGDGNIALEECFLELVQMSSILTVSIQRTMLTCKRVSQRRWQHQMEKYAFIHSCGYHLTSLTS